MVSSQQSEQELPEKGEGGSDSQGKDGDGGKEKWRELWNEAKQFVVHAIGKVKVGFSNNILYIDYI